MKKLLFTGFAFSFLLLSCKKDDNNNTNPNAEKYMNINAGSSWNYSYKDNNTPANDYNYTVTSTSRDTTASGKTYHVFTNSSGPNEYYNISGSDYYTMQAFNLAGTDTTFINLYLKDGAAVNESWTQNYQLNVGFPVDIVTVNKIQEKGISRTVGSTTYSNVIHVVTTISIPTLATLPGSSISTNIHYYYAPKFGLIENTSKIDLVVPLLTIDQHTDDQTLLTSATLL